MLLSTTKAFTQLYQLYASMDDVRAVFPTTTPEYVAAQTFFSQVPSTTPLMIGRRPADSIDVYIAPVVDDRYNYTITVNGSDTTLPGSGAVGESSVSFVNAAAGATAPWEAGQVINMLVCDVAIAPVTCSGVAATDIAALTAAMTTAGGANIGSITNTQPSTVAVDFVVPSATPPTGVPVVVSNIIITNGLPDSSSVSISLSSNTLAVQLALEIEANTDINTIVNASANGAQVVVSSILPETTGGPAWTISASSALVLAANAKSNDYNFAYIQVVTESSVGSYSCTINGVIYTYTADLSTYGTAKEASKGLYDAITTNAAPPTGVTVAYDENTELISLTASGDTRFVLTTSPARTVSIISRIYTLNPTATQNTGQGVQLDLDSIAKANNSWYALACTDRTYDTVVSCAEYALGSSKLFGTASSDPTIYGSPAGQDTTSVAAALNISGGNRTFIMYHQDAGFNANGSYTFSYPEMAWFGRMLNTVPGSQNWALKRLTSILPTVGLSTTEIQNIFSKNCNLFSRINAASITRWGTLSTGEYIYIDILRGADWLVSSISENVYAALISAGKIPYTDKGIEVVASIVSRQLEIAVENNYLSPSPAPTVSVPNAASVPASDKVARVLNNVTFTGTLAGAINTVSIKGTLTF
jgi:hypothetical protein